MAGTGAAALPKSPDSGKDRERRRIEVAPDQQGKREMVFTPFEGVVNLWAQRAQPRRQHGEAAQARRDDPEGESRFLDGLLGTSARQPPVEWHAALLSDPRLSHPVNAVQRVRVVGRLQRNYGNGYVQQVVDRVQAGGDREPAPERVPHDRQEPFAYEMISGPQMPLSISRDVETSSEPGFETRGPLWEKARRVRIAWGERRASVPPASWAIRVAEANRIKNRARRAGSYVRLINEIIMPNAGDYPKLRLPVMLFKGAASAKHRHIYFDVDKKKGRAYTETVGGRRTFIVVGPKALRWEDGPLFTQRVIYHEYVHLVQEMRRLFMTAPSCRPVWRGKVEKGNANRELVAVSKTFARFFPEWAKTALPGSKDYPRYLVEDLAYLQVWFPCALQRVRRNALGRIAATVREKPELRTHLARLIGQVRDLDLPSLALPEHDNAMRQLSIWTKVPLGPDLRMPVYRSPGSAGLRRTVAPTETTREAARSRDGLAVERAGARMEVQPGHVSTSVAGQITETIRRETTAPACSVASVPPGTLQRAFKSGLATTKLTRGFAREVYGFWKNEANRNEPLQALTDFMIRRLNEKLPHPCKYKYDDDETYGVFYRTKWLMVIDMSRIGRWAPNKKVGDLQWYTVGSIVEVIYHEARHAEQDFRVAQMLAGEGKTAKQIEDATGTPEDVAAKAVESPLKGDVKAHRRLIEEAKGWEAFTSGKHAEYSVEIGRLGEEIRALMGFLKLGAVAEGTASTPESFPADFSKIESHLREFFAGEQKRIEDIEKRDRFDESVLKNIKWIRKVFDELKTEYDKRKAKPGEINYADLYYPLSRLEQARSNAYEDLEHERDAFAAGVAAREAFYKSVPARIRRGK